MSKQRTIAFMGEIPENERNSPEHAKWLQQEYNYHAPPAVHLLDLPDLPTGHIEVPCEIEGDSVKIPAVTLPSTGADNISKEAFINGYCSRSGITREELFERSVVLPCACGDEQCKGWAVIENAPHSVDWHMQCYEAQIKTEKVSDVWTCNQHLTPVAEIPVGEVCPVCQRKDE